MKMLVLFYSAYGHVYRMAEAVAEGGREVAGTQVDVRRVPETLPEELSKQLGIWEAQKSFLQVPVAQVDDLAKYDAFVIGTPTRFGNMCGQMRQFIDGWGGLWAGNKLVGKVGSAFTSSNTQHGGQESTILSVNNTLFHLGMILVGLPYSFTGQMRMDEITGCSPYGASTIAGQRGERLPSGNELAGARFQGKHVAEIAVKLFG
jgi:NAD(P)H dehydrogenase (quinone)